MLAGNWVGFKGPTLVAPSQSTRGFLLMKWVRMSLTPTCWGPFDAVGLIKYRECVLNRGSTKWPVTVANWSPIL